MNQALADIGWPCFNRCNYACKTFSHYPRPFSLSHTFSSGSVLKLLVLCNTSWIVLLFFTLFFSLSLSFSLPLSFSTGCPISLYTLLKESVSQLSVGQMSSSLAHWNRHLTLYQGVTKKNGICFASLLSADNTKKCTRTAFGGLSTLRHVTKTRTE
jgi:hypothetical protein